MSHTEAFRAFERGTPAGNKLFHLYNKKSMDSTLDPELLARLQQRRREQEAITQPKPVVVPKSRAHVNVPKPARPQPTAEQIAEYKLSMIAKRKSAKQIDAERRLEAPPEAPVPSRPLITDKDKLKLQQKFEFGEVLPEVTNRAPRRPPTDAERLQDRFEELREEIAERKQFLAEMKDQGPKSTLGGANPAERRATEVRLMNEISDRIAEMKEIDDKLRLYQAGGQL